MRRNFSPPQLPVSSPPISALPQHFVFRPPPLLPLIHLIFLVLQHLLTLLLGSSFIHPRHIPCFPLSSPLLTLLFPLSPSFSSSSCSPFSSTFVFSSLSLPSLLFLCHPAFSIYRPVIFFFVVLLLPSRSPGPPRLHSHLSLIFLLPPILFLLLVPSCTFCSSNSYSTSAPTGKVG